MRNIENFIAGVTILSEYYKDGLKESYFMEAEHDEVFFHITLDEIPVKSKNGRKLIDLGFSPDDDIDVWKYST